jgi:hypothetical protein
MSCVIVFARRVSVSTFMSWPRTRGSNERAPLTIRGTVRTDDGQKRSTSEPSGCDSRIVALTPGAKLVLDEGGTVELLARVSGMPPLLSAFDVRTAEGPMFALIEEELASHVEDVEMAHETWATLRRVRTRARGVLGPEVSSRFRTAREWEGPWSYRDAPRLGPAVGPSCLLFSVAPTMRLYHALYRVRTPWPWPTVARFAVDLCRAFEASGAASLHPKSVGLAADGVWVLDPALDGVLRPPPVKGVIQHDPWTMAVLAPEALREPCIDHVVSLEARARFALGVILHELLTGQPLYVRDTAWKTLEELRRGMPPSLSVAVPGIPLDLAACVHALLDHDPPRRPSLSLVITTLEPLAAADLSWTLPLFEQKARPLDFLGLVLLRPR